tara:strand:- start:155 stop:919 length:765 start_codon:yes stop_codon:yes gene_type:complete
MKNKFRLGYKIYKNVIDINIINKWLNTFKEDDSQFHAHSDLLWEIRQNNSIKNLFGKIWNISSDKLCSSFDGAYLRKSTEESFILDWHVDQDGSHINSCVSIQGVLALTKIDKNTGGTSFLSKSHILHNKLIPKNKYNNGDWEYIEIDPSIIDKYKFKEIQPTLNPGDILLWDSRTIHRVVEPNNLKSSRGVVYLSMIPKHWISKKIIKKRKKAYENGISTTHWITRFVDRGEERYPIKRKYLNANSNIQKLIG